ncbi:putative glutathione S-transferase [Tasmannia lanceolata]|uniref:putative glutathione S-transferase n=1 Tax=Tasmannia lanceolata TaxID=3420 RepID=UPI0040634C9E
MEELKLFGSFISPFSRRVEWALKLKGIEYEFVGEDIINKSPSLLKYNSVHKKFPVLLHNGKPIVVSLVILEYIEETWKENPLLPDDPHEKAMARFWAKFIDEKSLALGRIAFFSQGEEREKALELTWEALKTLDEEIKGKKFFGGENIGLVDLVAGVIAYWFPVFDEIADLNLLFEQKFPSLYAWRENFIKVPAIKENILPQDQMLAIYRERKKKLLQIPTNE